MAYQRHAHRIRVSVAHRTPAAEEFGLHAAILLLALAAVLVTLAS